jgi:branched-chain amino acid aminotransferase
MNIFFRTEDALLTPSLHGSILPGITRASAIELLRAAGHRVEERRISIDEVIEGIRRGSLREAFGAGTAAIIAPVGRLAYRDEVHVIKDGRPGELTRWLYDRLTGIQLGEIEDAYGWNRVVRLDEPAARAAAG